MKTRFAIMFGAIALAFTLVLVSCATFQSNAGKFLATTAVVVDTSMQAWASFVVAGKTSTNQQAKVKELYMSYQGYMMVATNAYALAVTTGDHTLFTAPSNNLVTVKMAIINNTLAP